MTALVIYSIAVSSPLVSLPPLPDIPRGSLVIVEGRAPIWRYGGARLHGSPAAARAADPRLGAVVANAQPKVDRRPGGGCDAACRNIEQN